MRKLTVLFLCVSLNIGYVFSDEGMWLPLLLERYNISKMQEKGFKLSAEDVYSINQASIKDAIVRIGGCTAVLVSDEGLILTNHHCGYGVIQSHSSVENDYLTNGFWAKDRSQELPGTQTAAFLVRMEDVTDKILDELNEAMSERERQLKVIEVARKIETEAVRDTRYRAGVAPFYYGNQYFLFIYDVYEDVRLVGAPPSAIGKFGGDTDNWMWPRHTGDFTYFRIYAGENNEPAKYSRDNTPYKPKKFLPLSIRGVHEGDFTMVYGYPGTTQQYLTSHAVKILTELSNPHKIRLRDNRLLVMGREMEKNPAVRIQYASKYAGVANAWKRWIGENNGLARLNAVQRKIDLENQFTAWVNDSPERQLKYGTLLDEFTGIYNELEHYTLPRDYNREALMAIEGVAFAGRFQNLIALFEKNEGEEKIQVEANRLKSITKAFFKDYYQPVDRELFEILVREYYFNISTEFHPDFYAEFNKKFKGDYSRFANHVYSKTVFTNKAKVEALLNHPTKKSLKTIHKDPLYVIASQTSEMADKKINRQVAVLEFRLNGLYRKYTAGLMEMHPDKIFFPDANRTLRVAYGHVSGFTPRDGVYYKNYTTLAGIMEKDNPEIYDYDVPSGLKDLFNLKDYGIYGVDGTMPVAFIATNHTSGGNSGSPVINASGQLIGLNFDRVWEGTMSDIMFDPEMCRNISVDIRYVLFLTEKFAGAGHLLDEMTIIKE